MYIIMIKFLDKEFRCFKRYSSFYNLNLTLKMKVQEIKLTEMPVIEWLYSRKTKTIEIKKLYIEDFLL